MEMAVPTQGMSACSTTISYRLIGTNLELTLMERHRQDTVAPLSL